jgi:restriction endonuclease S subunit
MSNLVHNDDDLKNLFHGIHDYIRNHEAYYGMNALKIFNVIYTLKLLENKVASKEPLVYNTGEIDDNNKPIYDQHIFSDNCLFSSLVDKVKSGQKGKGKEKVVGLIYRNILDELCSKPALRDTLFYEIPREIKTETFAYIIEELDRISYDCDIGGKNYEYFVGRDPDAISELGAYFTNRPFIRFIIKKVNPRLTKNGCVPTMMDMFGGSGGFPIMYARYMIEQAKTKNIQIDWKKQLDHIHHMDNNIDVVKSARIELLSVTGMIPKNFIKRHSFYSEFQEKVKYIFTNPPYGGDKQKGGKKNQDNESRITLSRCNQQIKSIGIKGDNKENLSLQLMMSVLKDGGTCSAVMKEGIFFDQKFKNLRKELIENYNVQYIVSVPQDGFENTSTKTSVLIFQKGSQTENVEFSELIVHKTQDGEIENIEEKLIVTVSREQLIENDYSLSYKKYMVDETECNDGYEWKRLGGIVNFLQKSKKKASEGCSNGEYNFYTSSCKPQKCSQSDYDIVNYALIIGTGGNSSIHIDNKFSCSADNLLMTTENGDKTKFIFFQLKNLWEFFIFGMSGTTIKHITKEYVNNFKIPIPVSHEKMSEWVEAIGTPYELYTDMKKILEKQEKMVQIMIRTICRENDCDVYKLGDLCELKRGNMITKNKIIDGVYPVIGGGKSPMGYHNDFNRNEDIILVSQSGNSSGYVSRYDTKVWASDCFSVISKNDIISDNYIYYNLKLIQNKIYKYVEGNYTCQPHYNPSDLENQKIKIPKNMEILKKLEPHFEYIGMTKKIIKIHKNEYEDALNRLKNDATKNSDSLIEKDIEKQFEDEINIGNVRTQIEGNNESENPKEHMEKMD